MKWMGVCLTMTMLTGCAGQSEPTAAAQDETMEQSTEQSTAQTETQEEQGDGLAWYDRITEADWIRFCVDYPMENRSR